MLELNGWPRGIARLAAGVAVVPHVSEGGAVLRTIRFANGMNEWLGVLSMVYFRDIPLDVTQISTVRERATLDMAQTLESVGTTPTVF